MICLCNNFEVWTEPQPGPGPGPGAAPEACAGLFVYMGQRTEAIYSSRDENSHFKDVRTQQAETGSESGSEWKQHYTELARSLNSA